MLEERREFREMNNEQSNDQMREIEDRIMKAKVFEVLSLQDVDESRGLDNDIYLRQMTIENSPLAQAFQSDQEEAYSLEDLLEMSQDDLSHKIFKMPFYDGQENFIYVQMKVQSIMSNKKKVKILQIIDISN